MAVARIDISSSTMTAIRFMNPPGLLYVLTDENAAALLRIEPAPPTP